MVEDELRRLREENRLLTERLNQSSFVTDSEGNMYDRNDNLVRDSSGYLYSGGKVVGDYPNRFFNGRGGTIENYPNGRMKEVTHSEDNLWFRPGSASYYPDGKLESRSYRHSDNDFGWTTFWRNGKVRSTDVTLGNETVRREFSQSGSIQRIEITEGDWTRVKVFDEKGTLIFSDEYKL
jgi:antitoxin component YwqK of YwqJK toxin-antitoxin module